MFDPHVVRGLKEGWFWVWKHGDTPCLRVTEPMPTHCQLFTGEFEWGSTFMTTYTLIP